MQYHNLLVHESYTKLRKCGIDVFSVKTDAFVLRSSDLEKAHELIEFDNGFGTSRNSKHINIISPTHTLQQKETMKSTMNH